RTLALVPARALAAVHVSTDAQRRAVVAGARVAGRLPGWPRFRRDLLRRLEVPGCGLDLRRRPGTETTLAILPAGRGGSVSLLVTDAPADAVGEAPRPCGTLVARRVDGLVAIGEPGAVLAAQGVAEGRVPALVRAPVYRAAAAGLPADRAADAWASPAGLRRLLTPLGGTIGTLAGLLDTPGLRGAAAALSPTGDGADLRVRRITRRGEAPARFRPTLQAVAPADALAFLGSGDLSSTLGRLFELLSPSGAVDVRALADAGGGALRTLGDQGRESAIVIAPTPDGPGLTLLARVRDPARARAAMRRLEGALAPLAGVPDGVAWADARPGGVPARLVNGGPGRVLGWAVTRGDVLVLATSAAGIAALAPGAPALAGTPAYQRVLGDPANPRNPISSLVFLLPDQLLRLGDDGSTGAIGSAGGIRRDLARVRAIGARASGGESASTVDLSLWIP
ncbi:MAG: hypothetical protein MUC84_12125, partial [Solirubrobacteraceae bacterium]|nr:hypothetical protein [Solirubrobacteraceae bacterium]